MENKIHYTSSNEMLAIKKKLENCDSLYIVEINGEEINQLTDFLTTMSQGFQFPIPSRSLDSYYDWMRDLDWLNKDEYVLIITNYKQFLSQDLSARKEVIEGLTSIILPFWEEEVRKVVIEGEVKSFMVYLVE